MATKWPLPDWNDKWRHSPSYFGRKNQNRILWTAIEVPIDRLLNTIFEKRRQV
jgi:IS1 family transposase